MMPYRTQQLALPQSLEPYSLRLSLLLCQVWWLGVRWWTWLTPCQADCKALPLTVAVGPLQSENMFLGRWLYRPLIHRLALACRWGSRGSCGQWKPNVAGFEGQGLQSQVLAHWRWDWALIWLATQATELVSVHWKTLKPPALIDLRKDF